MKNVYLVTSGAYSDYTIHAAFETESDAQAYIAIASRSDTHSSEYEVLELQIGYPKDTTERLCWISLIHFASGDIEHLPQETLLISGKRPSGAFRHSYETTRKHIYLRIASFHAYSTVSQEHADKVAIEHRQQQMAFCR